MLAVSLPSLLVSVPPFSPPFPFALLPSSALGAMDVPPPWVEDAEVEGGKGPAGDSGWDVP